MYNNTYANDSSVNNMYDITTWTADELYNLSSAVHVVIS